jgi:hypothetical protein
LLLLVSVGDSVGLSSEHGNNDRRGEQVHGDKADLACRRVCIGRRDDMIVPFFRAMPSEPLTISTNQEAEIDIGDSEIS